MPLGNLNRLVWLCVAVVLVILAIQTRDNVELFFAGVGKLDVQVDQATSTAYLTWRGKIDAPMEQRLTDAYKQHRDEVRRFVLSLSSPGGSLDHGARVVRLLNEMAETHHLETVVEGRRVCASMCVPVYLQGRKRLAAPGARFMFHEVRFSEFYSDETVKVPTSAIAKATDNLFERYFVPAGVPERWIIAVRSEMTGGHDIWKTAQQLVDENAHIVETLAN